LQRSTTTNPSRKFPILSEIKEETDYISDEVIFLHLYSSLYVELYLIFPVFQIPNQPPPHNKDDPIQLSGDVGSPVNNLPPQAKVYFIHILIIKSRIISG
jgi:hypothetical protein